MRIAVLSAVAFGLLAGTSARAQDDAKAIIEKAIKAHGGAANLAKFQGGRLKSKGTINIMGQELTVSGTSVFQMPGKSKSVMELDVMGMKIPVVQLITPDGVTLSVNGAKQELNEGQMAEARTAIYLQTLYQLTPLLKEPFTLKALGETKFQGKTLLGVQVSSKDHKDVKLYFDKESGLLTKLERAGYDAMSMAEVPFEQVLSDYKDFDGVKRPVKTTIFKSGERFLDSEIFEYKPVEKVDDKEFVPDN